MNNHHYLLGASRHRLSVNGARRDFQSRRAHPTSHIKSSTVVPIVMRVPWSTPTMCAVRLKEVS
jgi:hypothetical protein